MRQYVRPQTLVVSCYGYHLLVGSPPKVDGGVYDSNGNKIEGTNFGFGGDGNSGDEGDAKRFDAWSTWDK